MRTGSTLPRRSIRSTRSSTSRQPTTRSSWSKAAADADDRILYGSRTCKIFCEAGGAGAIGAVLFAQVTVEPPDKHGFQREQHEPVVRRLLSWLPVGDEDAEHCIRRFQLDQHWKLADV